MGGKFTIEHWRDGEIIAFMEITKKDVTTREDGFARVVFPPGQITLATEDELHFNLNDAIKTLTDLRDSRK